MSPGSTFDPYELMPFTGYIEPSTGRQETYLSLAHFIHSERVAGVDEHYRRYLLQLDDPELFRLEVDGVGITSGDKPNWETVKVRLLYAGIYMQAISNRERYGLLLAQAHTLAIASCSFSQDAAEAMGEFVGDVQSPQDKLKVAFIGAVQDAGFIESCLGVVFARKRPQCLLAVEDDGCLFGVSNFARNNASSFALLDSTLSADAVAENIMRRSTHIFHFLGGDDSQRITTVLGHLQESGATVTPIQPKP
jgi:predicted NAD-dependent protein-ADP-ribosyltransferase YbiA (DUF1768 family)